MTPLKETRDDLKYIDYLFLSDERPLQRRSSLEIVSKPSSSDPGRRCSCLLPSVTHSASTVGEKVSKSEVYEYTRTRTTPFSPLLGAFLRRGIESREGDSDTGEHSVRSTKEENTDHGT